MRIKVTPEHINKGIGRHCLYCPMALAMRDAGLDVEVIQSGRVSIRPEGWLSPYLARLPKVACDFIIDFDCGESVGPFEFELELPTEEEMVALS